MSRGLIASSLLVALACSSPDAPPQPPRVAAATGVPFFDGMGSHTRTITTSSKEAQRYFDQGIAFLHGFNHDEAVRSFEAAAAADEQCAMAYWGIALALGPHINNPAVPPEHEEAAVAAIAKARAASGRSELETSLIEAIATRYASPQPKDRAPLDRAYADAMRELWKANPTDADVGTLFAEAMMDLRPWDLWTKDGKPHPGTEEIVETLEAAMVLDPDHPLALHLYIHAIEGSATPERAEDAADGLRNLLTGHGHLQHMPSHIDVRTGRWADAVRANEGAIAADVSYLSIAPRQDFYRLYMAHNRHMLAYGAMMTGQSKKAVQTIDDLVAGLPAEWVEQNPNRAGGYVVMPLEVRMRFGLWDEILATPPYPDHLPFAATMRHYARGVSHAAKGEPASAREELAAFLESRSALPASAEFGTNTVEAVVGVAEKLLEGEVLYREGKVKQGIAALKEAVEREDALAYGEPPDWIQPIRHALGAVLLKEKRAKEAEAVFREDLAHLPHNGWALWGLARSLRLQGKKDAAAEVDARFAKVWAEADIELHSSCMCLPGV